MSLLQTAILVVLGLLSLRGIRSAYVAFILAALLYFPVSVDFRLNPRACELDIDPSLAVLWLRDYTQIALAAAFFLMSYAQFRASRRSPFVAAGFATVAMGGLLEVAEGVTGNGHCRLHDLVPAAAGAVAGAALVSLWSFAWNAISSRWR
jgi:hypothetical protein